MRAETRKITARDELIRIYNGTHTPDFVSINPKQQSIAATRFYIEELHNSLNAPIGEDELDEGVVDGANDLGCDFIHRNDGHVIIIQSKFQKKSSVENPDAISHFKSILKRLRDSAFKPNRRLLWALPDIDWDRDSFELVFLTFGRMPQGAQPRSIAEQFPDYPASVLDIHPRCEWRFFDEEDLNLQLRNARNLQRGMSSKAITLYPGSKGRRGVDSVIRTEAGGYHSFIMTLDARQIQRMYQELGGDALFSLNIRNYIGNTKTNNQIINTATKDPEKFFIYNNGISCLSTKVDASEKGLVATGLQVINGAQTVKAIVHTAKTLSGMAIQPGTSTSLKSSCGLQRSRKDTARLERFAKELPNTTTPKISSK
jgi:hypothetical protein